jgi:hypothetical protein
MWLLLSKEKSRKINKVPDLGRRGEVDGVELGEGMDDIEGYG